MYVCKCVSFHAALQKRRGKFDDLENVLYAEPRPSPRTEYLQITNLLLNEIVRKITDIKFIPASTSAE